MDKSDSIKEAIDSGAFDDSPNRKAEVERYYQAFQNAVAMIEAEIVNINARVNIVDDEIYKNRIKQLFVGQGLDWSSVPEYQSYINNLSTDELKKVNLGIENNTIRNWSDLINAVDNYRKSLKETIKVEQNSPAFLSSIKSVSDKANELNSLAKIFSDVKDAGTFEFSSLADDSFVSTFSKYTDEFQSFVDTVTNSPNNINACQSAFDEFILHIIKDINFNMINVLLVFKIIIIVITSRLPCVPTVGTSVNCLTCTDWSPKEIYASCACGYAS